MKAAHILNESRHSSPWPRYILTSLFFLAVVSATVLFILAACGFEPFKNAAKQLIDLYPICIGVSIGPFYGIWGTVIFFLIVIVIYAIFLVYRQIDGKSAYLLGGTVSLHYLALKSIVLVLTIGWLFAWDRGYLVISSILLFLIAIINALSLFMISLRFYDVARTLYEKSKFDFYFNIIVLNGQALFSAWTSIDALINLGVAIAYTNNNGSFPILKDTCISILSVLLAMFIIYYVVEQTILMNVNNAIFTHYIVYLWAMGSAYNKNKNFGNDAVVNLLIANMSFAAIMLVTRIGFLIYYNRQNRVYVPKCN